MTKINSEEAAGYTVGTKHDNCEVEKMEDISFNGTKEDFIQAAISFLDADIKHGDAICSPEQTKDYLRLKLSHLEHEVFCVLHLDNRNRVIDFEEMFRGTIDGASVYPREVLKSALSHNSAAVIFAHCHPSGVTIPSNADEQITNRLKDVLALVDIRVLDHMIIGDDVTSMAELGLV